MTNENKTTCEHIELLIDENLEGMISLKDKELIDVHISNCPDCENYFKETSQLIKKLNSLHQATSLSVKKKTELWDKVESGIDTEKYRKEKTSKVEVTSAVNNDTDFLSKYRYWLTGAAALILFSLIFYGVKNIQVDNSRIAQQNIIGPGTYWKVSNIQGNSLIGDVAMNNYDSIKEGQFIRTNGTSRAELIIANMGKIIIEPNSKIIFIKGQDGNNRILVEYGTIEADMRSNPKTFFVEMPSAVASDLGGSYTLTIDSTGDGLVYVRSGKVEVQSQNSEAIIPAGNLVMTRKDVGVGTPFNENSSSKFKNALYNFDFGKCSGSCVSTLLNTAKLSDAVTLVNLIPKMDSEYQDEFYAKVSNFVAPPERIHKDSIPFINEDEINRWVDKIQAEVQMNVERSLKDVEKNLESLKSLEKFSMDSMKAMEDFAKNWKYNLKTNPKGNYVWGEDSLSFDKEQFENDMEDMRKDFKENNYFNKEDFRIDMEHLKEDLKEMNENLRENLNMNNEELKKEMEKVKEELKESMKEMDKAREHLKSLEDSTGRYRQKVKVKDGFEESDEKEDEEQK
ncbi:MAG: FecR family protein [bacterium]